MPELPEIETVRRVIGPQVLGRRIVSVSVDRPKLVGHPTCEEFGSDLLEHTFVGSGRRGKALLLILDGGTLIIRFGMTGQLVKVPGDLPAEKHTRLVFGLDDGSELRFIDQRMFGKVYYIPDGEPDVYSGIERMGPEPFDDALSADYLEKKLGGRGMSIKEALLDQTAVAGIGNIWGDEILFRCRLCPETPCNIIPKKKWKMISETIPEMMDFAIEKNRVTPEEYLEGMGRKYYDIAYLQAYGRKNKPCFVCGTPIRRSELGGRGSYWCPKCQKKPRKGRRPKIMGDTYLSVFDSASHEQPKRSSGSQ